MIYHHIYNRGAHKAQIFHEDSDYQRMLSLLYIANNSNSFHIDKISNEGIFETPRGETFLDIIAYCLMPNHIHLAVKSKSDLEVDPGISKFMHKLCTAYSMYYNKKYKHAGTIWQGPYKEKIANDEIEYVHTLITYIHTNPYAIKNPNISKESRKEHPEDMLQFCSDYEYSSLKDYSGGRGEASPRPRPQKNILCQKEIEKWKCWGEARPRPTI